MSTGRPLSNLGTNISSLFCGLLEPPKKFLKKKYIKPILRTVHRGFARCLCCPAPLFWAPFAGGIFVYLLPLQAAGLSKDPNDSIHTLSDLNSLEAPLLLFTFPPQISAFRPFKNSLCSQGSVKFRRDQDFQPQGSEFQGVILMKYL